MNLEQDIKKKRRKKQKNETMTKLQNIKIGPKFLKNVKQIRRNCFETLKIVGCIIPFDVRKLIPKSSSTLKILSPRLGLRRDKKKNTKKNHYYTEYYCSLINYCIRRRKEIKFEN